MLSGNGRRTLDTLTKTHGAWSYWPMFRASHTSTIALQAAASGLLSLGLVLPALGGRSGLFSRFLA